MNKRIQKLLDGVLLRLEWSWETETLLLIIRTSDGWLAEVPCSKNLSIALDCPNESSIEGSQIKKAHISSVEPIIIDFEFASGAKLHNECLKADSLL